MSQPATKAERWLEALHLERDVSQFEAERIVRDAASELRNVAPEPAADLLMVIWAANCRLGKFAAAAEASRKAARLKPNVPDYPASTGIALLSLHEVDEALEELTHALELLEKQPDAAPPLAHIPDLKAGLLANLAEAFFRSGDVESAEDALRAAIEARRSTDRSGLVILANQAAELGHHADAVELMARYVAEVRGKPLGPDEDALTVVEQGNVQHLIERKGARGLRRALALARMLRERGGEGEPTGTEGAEVVYAQTRGARARATAAVLGE